MKFRVGRIILLVKSIFCSCSHRSSWNFVGIARWSPSFESDFYTTSRQNIFWLVSTIREKPLLWNYSWFWLPNRLDFLFTAQAEVVGKEQPEVVVGVAGAWDSRGLFMPDCRCVHSRVRHISAGNRLLQNNIRLGSAKKAERSPLCAAHFRLCHSSSKFQHF